jgi:nucleoside-diphosphate-sugar epimerase
MWKNKKVLITGEASFIGSHLVDSLLAKGAVVNVADDFSSGKMSNYPLKKVRFNVWNSDDLSVFKGDLEERPFARSVMKNVDVVFHLAALHGGRGYIGSQPAQCCINMILDQLVFEEAHRTGVERVCFASSACVYPSYLQEETGSSYLLEEEDVDPFVRDKAFADLEYGWAKLMGEIALKAYHRQYGMKTSVVRIFTAYGPRENETHAIIGKVLGMERCRFTNRNEYLARALA